MTDLGKGVDLKIYSSPHRFMYILLASIVLLEVFIMLFLNKFNFSCPWMEVMLDAVMLFVLVYPIIIIYLYKPMKNLIYSQSVASEEIINLHSEMETIFDNVTSTLMVLNSDLIVQKMNRKGAAFFGCDSEAACGKYCGEAIGCVNSKVAHVFSQEEICKDCPVKIVVDNTFVFGENQLPQEAALLLEINDEPRIVYFMVSTSLISIQGEDRALLCMDNVTEMKESMIQFAEGEDRFRLLFENTRDAIFWADAETGIIINCNNAAAKLIEKNKKEIIGQHQSVLHPPEKMKHFVEMFKQHSMNKTVVNDEAEVITTSGKIVPVHISSSVTQFGRERINQGIFIDLTELKKTEAERVEREKFTAIGRVAGKIAHDFNNNLAIISSAAYLLNSSTDPLKNEDYIRMIVECARNGQKLTKNLILYARDRDPKFVEFDLNERIRLITMSLEKEMEGITVNLELDNVIEKFVADPDLLTDAITNLIINATHALSLAKNPELCIKTTKKDICVEIEIKDNGCGIPSNCQDAIFEPAFTLKGSHDNAGVYHNTIRGSGYGLANVKRCMEKHGATIAVQSQVGIGTSFTLSFPVLNCVSELRDEKPEERICPCVPGSKILVVEDEDYLCCLMKDILIENQYVVDIAVNAAQAKEMIDKNKYDLVCLDYMLPDFPGTDVYDYIRRKDKNIPVVFISGNIEFIHSINNLKASDENLDHIQKPFENKVLVNKLNFLCSRNKVL